MPSKHASAFVGWQAESVLCLCLCMCVCGGGPLISTEWKGVAGGKTGRDRRWRVWARVSVCVGMQACPEAVTPRWKIPLPRWRSHAGGTVVCVCLLHVCVLSLLGLSEGKNDSLFWVFWACACMCGCVASLILCFGYPLWFPCCLSEAGRWEGTGVWECAFVDVVSS